MEHFNIKKMSRMDYNISNMIKYELIFSTKTKTK